MPRPSLDDRDVRDLLRNGDIESAIRAAGEAPFLGSVAEDVAGEWLEQGRACAARQLIDALPGRVRTLELDLLAAAAAQAGGPNRPSEVHLRALVRRCVDSGDVFARRARLLVANQLRMEADPRTVDVCLTALGPLAGIDPADLDEHVAPLGRREQWAVAELLRLHGQILMLAGDVATIARGSSSVEAALDLLDRVDQSTISQRAWLSYLEGLLLLRPFTDVVERLRPPSFELERIDHADAALRVAELAIAEFFAGRLSQCRDTIERARRTAERTGNVQALLPLAGVDAAIACLDEPADATLRSRFTEVVEQMGDSAHLAPFRPTFHVEFGVLQVRAGDIETARRSLARARELSGGVFALTVELRQRRLAGLLAEADSPGDDRQLRSLRGEARTAGRWGLVALVDDDLDRVARAPVAITVRALGPTLQIDEPAGVRALTGQPGHVIALLVASGGSLAVDAVMESLWPGVDPEVGRHRLHQVIRRLRASLGVPANGPLLMRDDVVSLVTRPGFSVDAWDLEEALIDGTVSASRGSSVPRLLDGQFLYDDTVAEWRDRLTASWNRAISHDQTADSGVAG